MIISYWDCEYSDYEEWWDYSESDYIRIYGCTHPSNLDKYCPYENKWCNEKANCTLLDD